MKTILLKINLKFCSQNEKWVARGEGILSFFTSTLRDDFQSDIKSFSPALEKKCTWETSQNRK